MFPTAETIMKSTAQIAGHPIHPALIPYPFALLTTGALFDIGARMGCGSWARTATHLTNAGLASALVAAVPGIIDYFGSVPARTEARRSATYHALSNVSALACFAAAQARRGEDGVLPESGVALSLVGTALLSIGGWLGGELIYHHHVGVVTEEAEDRRLTMDQGLHPRP